MKQNKIIGILATLLFALLGLVVLRDYLPKNDTDGQSFAQHWNGYTADGVQEVVITKANDQLALKREGNEWMANGMILEKAKVDDLVTYLLKPSSQELIATTKTRHEALGFSDSSTSSALIKTGDKEQKVLYGSLTSTGRYVKFENNDSVYLIKGLPGTADSATLNDWVDKTLVEVPQSALERISIVHGRNSILLIQSNNEWREEGKDVILDEGAFSAMTSSLASLITQGLAEDQDIEVRAPEVEVKVKVKDTNEVTLSFSPFENEQYIVMSSARDGKYLISQSVVENFKIDRTDLVPKATPTPGNP